MPQCLGLSNRDKEAAGGAGCSGKIRSTTVSGILNIKCLLDIKRGYQISNEQLVIQPGVWEKGFTRVINERHVAYTCDREPVNE